MVTITSGASELLTDLKAEGLFLKVTQGVPQTTAKTPRTLSPPLLSLPQGLTKLSLYSIPKVTVTLPRV